MDTLLSAAVFSFPVVCFSFRAGATRRCPFRKSAHTNTHTHGPIHTHTHTHLNAWQHAVLYALRVCVCVCVFVWWRIGRESLPCWWTRYLSVLLFHLLLDVCRSAFTPLNPFSLSLYFKNNQITNQNSWIKINPVGLCVCVCLCIPLSLSLSLSLGTNVNSSSYSTFEHVYASICVVEQYKTHKRGHWVWQEHLLVVYSKDNIYSPSSRWEPSGTTARCPR